MPTARFSGDHFQVAADYLLGKIQTPPQIALVLGSCLGNLSEQIEDPIIIDYAEIPNFLTTTVSSHAGKLIFGRLAGRDVVCLSGRFHYYEGYEFEELVTPVRVLHCLGVKTIVLTNAAGGINTGFRIGDIMLINDHIKLMGASPMRGPNMEDFGPRFYDVTNMYTKTLQQVAREAAGAVGLTLREGVYYFFPGPQFETPSEIRAMRALGGDAVGMSTVTEALTAAHCGMQVLGFSLITNMAAGVTGPVSSEEVDVAANEASGRFKQLIAEVIKRI